jgi:hypothetical protein
MVTGFCLVSPRSDSNQRSFRFAFTSFDFAVMALDAIVAPLRVPGDKRSGRPPLGFRFGCKLEPDIIVMPSCARSTIPSGTSLTLS